MTGFDFSFIESNIKWLMPLIIGDAILRGYALWKASQTKRRYWFIALFTVSSLGILPLIFLLFFDKKVGPPTKKT